MDLDPEKKRGIDTAQPLQKGEIMTRYSARAPDGTVYHRRTRSNERVYTHAIATRGHRRLSISGWHCLHWCRDPEHAEELAAALRRTWTEVVVVAAEAEKAGVRMTFANCAERCEE